MSSPFSSDHDDGETEQERKRKKEKNFRYLTSCTPSSRKEGRPHKFSILGRCYYDINPRPHFYAFRTRPPLLPLSAFRSWRGHEGGRTPLVGQFASGVRRQVSLPRWLYDGSQRRTTRGGGMRTRRRRTRRTAKEWMLLVRHVTMLGRCLSYASTCVRSTYVCRVPFFFFNSNLGDRPIRDGKVNCGVCEPGVFSHSSFEPSISEAGQDRLDFVALGLGISESAVSPDLGRNHSLLEGWEGSGGGGKNLSIPRTFSFAPRDNCHSDLIVPAREGMAWPRYHARDKNIHMLRPYWVSLSRSLLPFNLFLLCCLWFT